MKTARAAMVWYLRIECPHCDHEFDLVEHDEDGIYSKPIFTNQWHNLKGEEVECNHCHEVFQIEEVEY